MTVYDAAMVGVIVLGMIWGAIRGITWQIASIASLVLGYLVAFPISSQLAPHFPGDPVVARALALLATYAGVSGGVFLVAWMVRSTLRQWKFEAFDRHLGMILGGLEGAFLGLLATVFVVSLAPQSRSPIFSSPAGHVVSQVLDTIEPILPSEIWTELAPFWNGLPAKTLVDQKISDSGPAADEATDPAGGEPSADGKGPSSLVEDLVQEGESRVNQVIRDVSKKGVDTTSQSHDRNVERR
jgi:membrane protein required for colicin V production